MEQMTKKHNETGRSMVEMLGVLAVVGVLSIGGVAGYRYAVDKMNANEIINELKKRAITASQQRVLGQDINLAEYGVGAKIKGTYTVTPTKNYDGNASQFALAVAGVPERVCDMILESDWELPSEILIAGEIAEKGDPCDAGGNMLTFAFSNTLDSGAVVGGNGEGNEGNNDPTDTPTQQCGENEYRLVDGTCKEDTNCSDPNQFYNALWNVEACVPCPTEGNPVQNDTSYMEDSCTKCANAQVGWSSYPPLCIWCPSNRVVCGDTCCGEGQQCRVSYNWPYTYTCVDSLGANECLINADCNNGSETGDYYCENAGGCGQMIGTCQPATLYNNGESIDVHGKSVVRSADQMSWDAAKNFCAAHNMSLFNPKPYCTANEWLSIQNSDGWGFCTKLDVTNDNNWFGWTGTASGSCSAYDVRLSSGAVGNGSRSNSSSSAALCVGS